MNNKKVAMIVVATLSVVVPALVAVLIYSPYKISADYEWLKSIPRFNATINSLTAVLLIFGGVMAKRGNIALHKLAMSLSLFLGVCFLLAYVTYHSTMDSVIFGDANMDGVLSEVEENSIGGMRTAYLTLLLSHIMLSAVVVPFVLLAFYFALAQDFVKHVKIVKFTWPIWLYVSVTGPIVYWMASPYYPL
ncbi:DUF420 domain-containing protein [Reichenbachiella agarivorans]|uniref:DUF420 domain-containing protein n=1 Tax=Reichenbachiella agarivorans TaxID=2979464 RepID=A0ABY6CQS3_9BACT|nr:DUF420 domain-containing protein [Reichenbachiella agarivorans]UXP32876.1 DUF420 domain-containing protein [Reichenbachiella agarivorans]